MNAAELSHELDAVLPPPAAGMRSALKRIREAITCQDTMTGGRVLRFCLNVHQLAELKRVVDEALDGHGA